MEYHNLVEEAMVYYLQNTSVIKGWFGWWKSRLISADSIVFCERE
jgi:hypothetical protein